MGKLPTASTKQAATNLKGGAVRQQAKLRSELGLGVVLGALVKIFDLWKFKNATPKINQWVQRAI